MADVTHVLVPRENVNDEVVILVKWHVPSGERVAESQLLAEIETSKTVLDIHAPRSGFLQHRHAAGGEVAVGDALCVISDEPVAAGGAAPPAPPAPPATPVSAAPPPDRTPLSGGPGGEPPPEPAGARPANVSVRLSAAAAALAREHDIDPVGLAGRGLVRARDLAEGMAPARRVPLRRPAGSETSPQLVAGVPTTREPLPRRKLMELRTLAGGAAGALPSWVSIACPTRGLRRLAAARQEMQGNATALVLFEAARLLRQFPVFNAAYDDGAISYYQEVNVGFAVDAGHGLKVPVVHHADTKPLAVIAAEMQRAIYDYMEDTLPLESLTRGTFCVSDLSGEEVTSFRPLISEGHAAILGIAAECFPGAAAVGTYELVLAFDHRVAEGRVAGQFLRALRDRLAAHETALASGRDEAGMAAAVTDSAGTPPPACSRCGRGKEELLGLDGFLVASAHPQGHLCSICLGGF